MRKFGYLVLFIFLCTSVFAECDESNIIFSMNENNKELIKQVNQNVDNSFKSYEQYNTAQFQDFLSRTQDIMTKASVVVLVSIAGLVSMLSAFWHFIMFKRMRRILTLSYENNKFTNKILMSIINKNNFDVNDEFSKLDDDKPKKPNKKEEKELKSVEPTVSFSY